nr:LamG-like jellyroll fold domain-containing protein [uncultured Flavobacterium sp.]
MKKTTLYFPKIIGTTILLFIGFFSYAQTQTFTSNGTFTVPSGITTLQVEAWGGGGKGGTRTSNGESGGGGGGAYAKKTVSVIAGTTYNVQVGTGSSSTSAGGDSWFIDNSTILAKGGNSVANNSTTGVIGGSATASIGTVKLAGGKGADGTTNKYGGGGGSSAGILLNGTDATNASGAIAPTGGGKGGNARSVDTGSGTVGSVPGGGGGGAYRISSVTASGGNGANGQVRLTWGPQEINVQGNNSTIANGDNTPSSADGTDFGSVDASLGTITKTFTIQNIGSSNLILSTISINSTEFSITAEPTYPATITGASSTTFSITFNPTSSGTKTATISIGNNDSNESVYTFTIIGSATQTFYDSDGDLVFDNIDIDDDNDGIKDETEELNCESASANRVNYKFLNETFGTGNRTTINTTYDAYSSYCYEDGTGGTNTPDCPDLSTTDLNDGKYTVGSSAQIATWAPSYWYLGKDHTTPTDPNGRMALFNASYTPGIFYTALITGSLPNVPITYSFWVINLDRTDAPGIATRLRPNIKVEFRDLNDNLLATITTNSITADGNWHQFTSSTLSFNVSAFKVIFINNETGGTGNDLAIDDIQITQTLCDLDYDGVADLFDLDADNDGIEDVIEVGLGNLSNGKGKISTAWTDANSNGLHDSAEATAAVASIDSDGDGVPNYIDLDSDNDTLFDVDESGAGNTNAPTGYTNGDGDSTGDGRGDGLESEAFRSKDTNGDGIIEGYGDGILDLYDYGIVSGATTSITPTNFQIAYGNLDQGTATAPYLNYVLDTDGDTIPDYLDVKSDGVSFDISKTLFANLDTDADGIIGATGYKTDIDKDGILDSFDTNTAYFGSPRDLNRKLYLDFDGRNDYGQSTAILGGLASATLMAWINLNATFAAEGVVIGQDKFQLRITAAKKLEAEVNGTTVTFGTALSSSRWYHVGVVYNGNTIQLFLNGAVVASQAKTGTIAADASLLSIGKDPLTSTKYFKGKIDEVRVFNVGLTDSQFQRIVYQEINENSIQLTGAIIPKEVAKATETAIPFANMVRCYRMDAYKDDIIDDLSTATIDLTGTKIVNHKNIYVQEAPMPFLTERDGDFATAVNSTTKEIIGQDIMDQDWSIVKVQHDITETANNIDLGMLVDAGKNIIINNDNKLQNDWYLKLDGKIDLVGQSQLVQTTNSDLDAASSGSIERDQQGQSNKYNYNYWSSPVNPVNTTDNNTNYTVADVMKDGTTTTPQNITWVSGYDGSLTAPISLANYWIFKFENNLSLYANWIQVGQSGALRVGQGYTLKGCGVSGTQNYTFTGKPNNGTITSNTVSAGQLLLVGNPYPSALDGYTFIEDNLNTINTTQQNGLNGSLYFWEHSSDNNTHILVDYKGGYAVLNLSGGVAPVVPAGISGVGLSAKIPKQYIPVGQGFFVFGKTGGGGPVIFNNGQRSFQKESDLPASVSNTLFKTNTTGKKAKVVVTNANDPVKKDTNKKIRLGFNSSNNYHRQVLLAFMGEKATSGIDYGYDARRMDNYPNDMYLINGNEKLVIEGESVFNKKSSYPIGVKTATAGVVEFKLDSLENFNKEQPIYIYDDVTKTYNDIREKGYKVTLPQGENKTRFALRFNAKTKNNTNGNNGNFENEEDEKNNSDANRAVEQTVTDNQNNDYDITITHLQESNMLIINNTKPDVTVEKVTLYNSIGQSVNSWEVGQQTTQQNIQIPISSISTGIYIAQIKTTTGIISKKIILK